MFISAMRYQIFIERNPRMTRQTQHNYKLNPDGSISTRNLCAASLPEITVEITSGRTTYRFTGHYDGARSLSSKLLARMSSETSVNNLQEE